MQTTASPKGPIRIALLTTALLAVFGGGAMWFLTDRIATGIFIAAGALLTGGFMALVMGKRPPVQLTFTENQLHICDSNGQIFVVYDVPASDFICRQTKRQIPHDTGNIQVKNTRFYFYDVRNYSQVCAYIKHNFDKV